MVLRNLIDTTSQNFAISSKLDWYFTISANDGPEQTCQINQVYNLGKFCHFNFEFEV